jgi:predicted nucleic acid-binding protein
VARTVIVDTGFWFGLLNKNDPYHDQARRLDEFLVSHEPEYEVAVPWPCLYETLNTRFVKNKGWLEAFEKKITGPNFVRIVDDKYREQAWNNLLLQVFKPRELSLTDLVIREILQDASVRVYALITFNERDFADLGASRGFEIWSS